MKKKKVIKYRGSKTHGCGSMKKRRGAGNRGGRGNAGTGKRGDCKKPVIWKNTKYFGVHGFKNSKNTHESVNLCYLENSADTLFSKGMIKKEGEYYIVDLDSLGYSKLLSKGVITKKFKIKCDSATAKAMEKVKNLGGTVIVSEN